MCNTIVFNDLSSRLPFSTAHEQIFTDDLSAMLIYKLYEVIAFSKKVKAKSSIIFKSYIKISEVCEIWTYSNKLQLLHGQAMLDGEQGYCTNSKATICFQ